MQHDARLTSGEIAGLWTQYITDTMSLCINRYMLNTVNNEEISSLFDYAIQLGEKHKRSIEAFFNAEEFPIPKGFTEEDVDLNAPRLFSDEFCLYYLHEMTIHGLSGYGISLPISTRKDIRNYFTQCNIEAMEVYNRTCDMLLGKGLYERPPNITNPISTDFVKDKSFLSGWFGERRALNVIEISDIYFILKKTILAKTIVMASSQITENKQMKELLIETLNLSNKHIDEFNVKLQENSLPIPSSYEDHITDSTVSPFSDRLLLFHVAFLFQVALGYYGAGMAVAMRADIVAQYEKTINELIKGAGKTAALMIKNGFMEEPPLSDDRIDLIRS